MFSFMHWTIQVETGCKQRKTTLGLVGFIGKTWLDNVNIQDFRMKYPLEESCALANKYLKQVQVGLEPVP